MVGSNKKEQSRIRLAADIGGTFTDVAAFDEDSGSLRIGKVLSTPDRLVDGIEGGVAKAEMEFAAAGLFLHGSTIAVNTILERTGAKTALITTEGFRDVYEIGRINRPDSYNLYFQKHEPLVERALRFEAKERTLATGEVLTPLDETDLASLGAKIHSLGIEAVAILFLHCYLNPEHEIRAKEILEQAYPDMFVSASHELSQEYREFERTSTVVANAYIGPKVRSYISEIEDHLRGAGFHGSFLVVQSHRWPVRGQGRAKLLRADAGIRPGRRGHWNTGAVRRAGPSERHCVRHGGDHRKGRRNLQGARR